MVRLYLHIRHDGDLFEDVDGADFPTLADARDEAIVAAREILSEQIRFGKASVNSSIEITDEGGRLLLIVTFEKTTTAR